MHRAEIQNLIDVTEQLVTQSEGHFERADRSVEVFGEASGARYTLDQVVFSYAGTPDGIVNVAPAEISADYLTLEWFEDKVDHSPNRDYSTTLRVYKVQTAFGSGDAFIPASGPKSDVSNVFLYDPRTEERVPYADTAAYEERRQAVVTWMLAKLRDPSDLSYSQAWSLFTQAIRKSEELQNEGLGLHVVEAAKHTIFKSSDRSYLNTGVEHAILLADHKSKTRQLVITEDEARVINFEKETRDEKLYKTQKASKKLVGQVAELVQARLA
jgi:hypothetical protein